MDAYLNAQELGFSWWYMIWVSFQIKYVHLGQIRWILMLAWIKDACYVDFA